MLKLKCQLFAFILAVLTTCTAAIAHEGAMGIVAERMAVMKEMALSMKTIGEILKGQKIYDADIVKDNVTALYKNYHLARDQFPIGTNDHTSRATPAVWKKTDEFKAEMDTFNAAVKALVSASEIGNPDALRIPFKNVGQSCSSCHEQFRLPE